MKPKKTKLGIPLESESIRRKAHQLVADASLAHENDNETDLTVEIEVLSLTFGHFD